MLELLAEATTNRLWYAVPLIVSVSLVYGATRHELMSHILNHAARAAIWIVGFIFIVFAVLLVASWAV